MGFPLQPAPVQLSKSHHWHTRLGDAGGFSLQRQKRTEKIEKNPLGDVLQAGQKQGPSSFSLNGKEAREHTGGRAPATERGHQARRERGRFPARRQGERNSPLAIPQKAVKPWGWAEFGGLEQGKAQHLRCHQPWDTALPGAAAQSTLLQAAGQLALAPVLLNEHTRVQTP